VKPILLLMLFSVRVFVIQKQMTSKI